MKKILTASLVAMMAVTAANAEIASTTYVDDRTGDVANSTYVKSLAEGKRNLASAVDALAANMGDGGSVESQIESKIDTFENDVIGDLGDSTNVADAIADAKQEAIDAADTKIGALDVAEKTAADGSYFSAYKQEDGEISMTEKAFDTSIVANDQGVYTSKNAPSSVAVADFVAAQLSATSEELNKDIDTAQQTADDALGKANGNADDIEDLQDQISDVAAGTTLAENAVKTKNIDSKAVTTAKIADGAVTETQLNSAVNASLDKADSAVQQADVTTGTTNGTIKVKGTEVPVAGLGTAAYTESSAYATAAQGAKADTAMQVSDLQDLASWSSEGCATGTCSLVSKNGSIAWEKVSY